jgi:hypothetical protein
MDYYTNPPYYLTAYGLAVKYGYQGTEEEWLASLRGPSGMQTVVKEYEEASPVVDETKNIGGGSRTVRLERDVSGSAMVSFVFVTDDGDGYEAALTVPTFMLSSSMAYVVGDAAGTVGTVQIYMDGRDITFSSAMDDLYLAAIFSQS